MRFIFHHDSAKLPEYDSNIHPVLIYDKTNWNSHHTSTIGSPIINKIRDLGVKISDESFDFMTIAMAVTGADSFCLREESPNNWARILEIELPLINPALWSSVKEDLERILGFLTGDQWSFNFIEGGLDSPDPKSSVRSEEVKETIKQLKKLNCVSLFSGGIDSIVGAIDKVNLSKQIDKPLLVSHGYKGDAQRQDLIQKHLKGTLYHWTLNANPRSIEGRENDTTMRSRSFNFIAMALVGLSALQKISPQKKIRKIFIPENGYIALNPPLTRRRIGSLSTRTTHPYFLSSIENILQKVGFDVELINPYAFKTKGEMLKGCADQKALNTVLVTTVSCSNWHRKNIQCGRCVPCIIRRASIYKAGISMDLVNYEIKKLKSNNLLGDKESRDDLYALIYACKQLSNKETNIQSWVRKSGSLPQDKNSRDELFSVFQRGLEEVAEYLKSESVL